MTDQQSLQEQESIDPNVDYAVGNEAMVMSGNYTPRLSFLTGNLRQSGIYVAFVAIVLLFALLNGNFLSPGNLTNIVLQYSYILILAVGMSLVIIGGHIDLSVGSVVAFTGAVAAVVVIQNGMPWWVGVLAALATGTLVGVWQGFWVAYVGIPSFIVTLAGMLLFRGLTFRTLDNVSLSPFGGAYYEIANGFQTGVGERLADSLTILILVLAVAAVGVWQWRSRQTKLKNDQPVGSILPFVGVIVGAAVVAGGIGYVLVSNHVLADLLVGLSGTPFTVTVFALAVVGYAVSQWRARQAKIEYRQTVEPIVVFIARIVAIGAVTIWFGYQLAKNRGLPNILIILAVLVLVYGLVATRSVFGRHIYAIGGNLHAAELSGVKVKRVNFGVMVNMGFLAGLAGVAFSARMNGAQPGAGNMFELDAIAACFIGGASTTGGVGSVTGAMVGGLIMAVMSNGMQLMGIEQSVQQIVKGIVLLLAVAFDIYNKRRASAG